MRTFATKPNNQNAPASTTSLLRGTRGAFGPVASLPVRAKLTANRPGDNHEQEADRVAAEGTKTQTPGVAFDFSKIRISAPAIPIQPKLTVNQPGDKYEQEADRIAEEVMRVPDFFAGGISLGGPPNVQKKCAACESGVGLCPECEKEEETKLQRKTIALNISQLVQRESAKPGDDKDEEEEFLQAKNFSGQNTFLTPDLNTRVHALTSTGGIPLPETERTFFEPRFGFDFSPVRVFNDASAADLAHDLNASAFTIGHNIAFGPGQYAPETNEGRRLMAHELTHVVQQTSSSNIGIQRVVGIDDVSGEMNGATFSLIASFQTTIGAGNVTLTRGQTVVIRDWRGTNTEADVNVTNGRSSTTVRIPKRLLEPVSPSATNVRRYDVGLGAQRGAVIQSEQSVSQQQREVSNWRALEGQYRTNRAYWESALQRLEGELTRREGVLQSKQQTMSRMLVRQTMYNRFDTDIRHWVDHYNRTLSPNTNLNANVVKSIIFQESRFGTQGTHLELPPYSWSSGSRHPIRSRFNIGQAVDSWGAQQYLMIKEMAPSIYMRYGLSVLETRAIWRGMTNEEYARWSGGSGSFMDAVREFFQQRDAGGRNLMGTSGTDLHADYGFWIRTLVRWLFYKYFALGQSSWSDAVRAYNGSGPRAESYRQNVMRRVGSNSGLNVGSN